MTCITYEIIQSAFPLSTCIIKAAVSDVIFGSAPPYIRPETSESEDILANILLCTVVNLIKRTWTAFCHWAKSFLLPISTLCG